MDFYFETSQSGCRVLCMFFCILFDWWEIRSCAVSQEQHESVRFQRRTFGLFTPLRLGQLWAHSPFASSEGERVDFADDLTLFCEILKREEKTHSKLTIRSHHVVGRNMLFFGLCSVLGAVPPVHTLISLGQTTAARVRYSTVNACNR